MNKNFSKSFKKPTKLIPDFRNFTYKEYLMIFFITLMFILITPTCLQLQIFYCVEPLNDVDSVDPLAQFFESQHNLRVAIITERITNTFLLDELHSIHEMVKAKVALLWEPIFCNDPTSLTCLEPDFKVNPHPVKSIMLYFSMLILYFLFQGIMTFCTIMFSDITVFQEIILNNFLRITHDYVLVNDLYNMLIQAEILTDSE